MKLDDLISTEHTFQLRRLTQSIALSQGGIILAPERVRFEIIEHEAQDILRGVITYLTQEEPLCKYPANWWEAFKLRVFPRWLKRKTPAIKMTEVWAVHRFPELDPPESMVGREFISLHIVNQDKLEGNKDTKQPKN